MFGKKLVVSVFALTIGAGVAIAASTSRSGSLRVNPATQSVKSVSNPVATTSASSRMATLPGPTNISTKPKLPSAASAAQVGDLKDIYISEYEPGVCYESSSNGKMGLIVAGMGLFFIALPFFGFFMIWLDK